MDQFECNRLGCPLDGGFRIARDAAIIGRMAKAKSLTEKLMPEPRKFICPLTEVPCVHGGCKIGERCIEREREEAAFRQKRADARERRLRPRIDPVTGKMYARVTPEDWEELGL